MPTTPGTGGRPQGEGRSQSVLGSRPSALGESGSREPGAGSRGPGAPEQARALARLLDTAVRVPGTDFRIGLDPILGLIPGVGDLVGGALSAYVLLLAARTGASKTVLLRMLANLGVDSLVGTVPLVGDLFDAGYKANARNVALLERYLARPHETERTSGAFVALLLAAAALLVVGGIAATVLVVRWMAGQLG